MSGSFAERDLQLKSQWCVWGGQDEQNALSSYVIFCQSALLLVALSQKETCNLSHSGVYGVVKMNRMPCLHMSFPAKVPYY